MELNDKVAKYKEIKSLIESLESELNALSEEFKAMGSFDTQDFTVKVSEQSREFLKGIKEVAAVVGRDVLDQNGLIGTTTYKVVRVIEKKVKAKEGAA